jgi:hypothetical protein
VVGDCDRLVSAKTLVQVRELVDSEDGQSFAQREDVVISTGAVALPLVAGKSDEPARPIRVLRCLLHLGPLAIEPLLAFPFLEDEWRWLVAFRAAFTLVECRQPGRVVGGCIEVEM